ncbi:MAG: hypothetical protein PHX44_06350 [Sulfurimonas sp.]|uniref:hypothetical protein n=1 Tax=Sulfurimonas sp. TaxID=2022749 RepID=UPI0026353DC0|nr:hypothetical protein [Sulfurimonas sp.]MDD2652653.1 hypothetical protein [Sulfurimonas sp.]MDD3450820.1 hypothetical protein [Sulfurimonas sp.]
MFVSSYNTYVQTDNTNKSRDFKANEFKKESFFLSEAASNEPAFAPRNEKSLPIDYISNYKSFQNQQKLQEQLQGQDRFTLKGLNVLADAKNAYEESAKKFSLAKKPTLALDLTPKIDITLPQETKEAKVKTLRHVMINTYVANENYYRITAA